MYFIRRGFCYLFNLYPPFSRGYEAVARRFAVESYGEIKFPGNVYRLLHQDAPNLESFGAGLRGNKFFAEKLFTELLSLFRVMHQFDAACLATSTGVNLRLYYAAATHLLGRPLDLVCRERDPSSGDRYGVAVEDFLCLIFMDVHL